MYIPISNEFQNTLVIAQTSTEEGCPSTIRSKVQITDNFTQLYVATKVQMATKFKWQQKLQWQLKAKIAPNVTLNVLAHM